MQFTDLGLAEPLLRAVRGAREKVLIGTPYFVPRLRLLAALTGALRRGVHVELVVPSLEWAHPLLWYAARRYVGVMLQRGAVVRYYAPSFYHAKIAVVDDTHAFLGSSNLDGWSWRRNAELDLVFTDAATVAEIAACFDADREHAPVLTRDEHRKAGLRHRTWQSVARVFARWL